MKTDILAFLAAIMILISCSDKKEKEVKSDEKDFVVNSFEIVEKQLSAAIEQYQDLTKFPRSTNPDGTLHTRAGNNWISGFFPGCLWLTYEYSGDKKWKAAAEKWTEALNEQQYNTGTHDVGFIINCSYGNGLRLTKNEAYAPVLIQTAKSLMTRYNEKVGCTKSWDWSDAWKFPVIIDNMMNMELLFEASKLTGDESFKNAAIDHAKTTMKNHYRNDNSSIHVVDYDPETGVVLERITHQGTSDESAWARGQAWGLYGYTVCFRETQDPAFLEHAEKIAQFIINHPRTPEDLIPYWDYDAPDIPNEPRDASAAAIMASALLELSTYSNDHSEIYVQRAGKLLKSLASDEYLASPGTNNNFILKHCTGNKRGDSEVDSPLIYGDYYFIEALLRYKKLKG
ncbi:MAG: glycoside hydrolase family 88 protein [Cyclobacteriaceae bacterium]|nr:glycoside hydrolase family 88 protein [Cyclobacteriaceae bacterium]